LTHGEKLEVNPKTAMEPCVGEDFSAQAEARLEEFFRAFGGGGAPLLLLDYDGTLAPFQVDRFKAQPWPGVRQRLKAIQRQKKTQMAVITGRPAAEIAPLLGVEEPVEVWGLHGAERLYADGRCELEWISEDLEQELEALRGRLRRDSFGGVFEDKPNAAVMHWRGSSPEVARRIEEQTRALFEPLARERGFRLLEFAAGLELRAGRDKSAAVEALLNERREPGPAAFLGDDITDEEGFCALRGRGLTVLVRPEWRATAAEVWLRPPEELCGFLDRWIAACGGVVS
jgi:trehalose 6-phosphate phosphatase